MFELVFIYMRGVENGKIPRKRKANANRVQYQFTDFASLFYEPFYQLMRQQFLAFVMEKAHELGAHIVSLLHIAPARNTNFRKITSPDLAGLGESATGVWKKLVMDESRFMSVNTEHLFGDLLAGDFPEVEPWLDYLYKRFDWLNL